MSWDRRNQNYHDEHDRGRFDHGNYDDRYRDPGNFRGRDLRADRGNGERFDDIRDFQKNDFDEGSDRNFGRGRYESHGYMDNPDDNYLHPLPPDGHARYGREIIPNADNRRTGKDGKRFRMEVDNHFSNDSQQDHRYSGERMEMRNMNSEDYFERGRHENPAPHRFYDEDMHTKADIHHQQNDFGARDEYYEDLDEVDLRVRPNYGADQLRAKSEPREYEQYDFDERKRDNAWEKRSDNKRRPYQSQPDLIGGHQNMGFEGDLDENDPNYRPKVHRGVSLRRRTRKSRRERRSDFQNEQRMSFADGMKTIIQRRKTLHMHRPLSELMSSSRTNRPGSVFHGPGDDDIDDEDDRLPSNRNKKRMTLKERMEIREKKGPLTTEDMAKLLRDKVLSQEASHGLDLQNFKMKWHSFTSWTKNWVYQLELWAGAFKVIEGHFGQSTVSYFRFLRWLMFLNLFMTLIMFGVVLLPFLSLDIGGSFVSSVNACSSIPNNMAVFYTLNYTADVKSKVNQSSTAEKVQDVLQGTGWMENTVLFYGAYHNKTAYLITGDAFTYNMSLAYLCAVGLTFMLSFILLVKK
ncbi:transmembrane channel-like protein 2-A isoform X1 [Ruditapes philippinarum]|uniref:transmembrane channel-like protein 2-A isoform X1 n=1 Tax=Ruditapes philippinarum TaxID=129788 RepID=UPI00295B2CDF|nr:transmembrane channel-like protein 2-A isoform X1 [Ruditapes philippinarum]